MNGIRLLLIALGSLFVLAACGGLIGAIDAAREREAGSLGLWLSVFLVEVVLVSIGVVLIRLAGRVARRQRQRDAAPQSDVPAGLVCPRCESRSLAQGSESTDLLFRKSYEARCLKCGERVEVSAEEWRQLPIPEMGDAFETPADRQHLIRRLPMTTGQTVFVLLGLLAWVAIFIALGRDKYGLSAPAFVLVLGSWWLGRLLFRPRGSSESDGKRE
jgi:hypothetical protein